MMNKATSPGVGGRDFVRGHMKLSMVVHGESGVGKDIAVGLRHNPDTPSAILISLRVSQKSSDSLIKRDMLQAQGLPQEFMRKSDDIFQGPFGVILVQYIGNQLFAKGTHHKQSLVCGSLINGLLTHHLQELVQVCELKNWLQIKL